jgi:hypothetical protein
MARDPFKIASSPDDPMVTETIEDHSKRKPLGGSTSEWRQWAKSKPNRTARAKATIKEMNESEEAEESIPNTMTKANSKARNEVVRKWQRSRPESGAHKAKSKEEAEQRRNNMIAWAEKNPNRRSNANRAVKQGRKKK